MAIFNPANLVTLITLALLEIVLGIDNVIFIAILSGRLACPSTKSRSPIGIDCGVADAYFVVAVVDVDYAFGSAIIYGGRQRNSGRDVILLVGGLFLIAKSTMEMHHSLEGADTHVGGDAKKISFRARLPKLPCLTSFFRLIP
jgi:predicted tellurium resistance membrane protein TerC